MNDSCLNINCKNLNRVLLASLHSPAEKHVKKRALFGEGEEKASFAAIAELTSLYLSSDEVQLAQKYLLAYQFTQMKARREDDLAHKPWYTRLCSWARSFFSNEP